MSVIVKICGLSTPEMVDAALEAGADMLGFVQCAKSPRHVSLETAEVLGRQVGTKAAKVLVTVDIGDQALADAIEALKPDALQLHGHESAERVGDLRKRFGLPVIKAIGIGKKSSDIGQVSSFGDIADLILFDAASSRAEADLPGGNGEAFDWRLLQTLDVKAPWLLAGGLTPENVGEALKKTAAHGVDVSSGVESSPGVKDADKIAAFVANARAAADARA
ncbi:MAG: phosphoribosylanthranilate isomerase [Methylovirgula sp.]|jgi:phosphoribosylanthranilate isomerase